MCRGPPGGLAADGDLDAQAGDFPFKLFVFGDLAGEEAGGDARFGFDALRCEQVGVGELVLVVLEVVGLDPALVEQCAQAVVDFAEADAEGFGELTLADLRALREELEEAVVGFVAHGTGGTLPPYRVKHGTAVGGLPWTCRGGAGDSRSEAELKHH